MSLLVAALDGQVRPDAGFASAMAGFTRELFNAAPVERGENVVLSPFSVSSCLALLLPGTSGHEQQRLTAALQFKGLTPAQALEAYGAFKNELKDAAGSQLQVANGVWTAPGYVVTPTYKQSVVNAFDGEARTLPSLGPSAVQEINAWISDKTKGRIPRLFQSLSPSTTAVLANAVSFDGVWQRPFVPALTKPRAFHQAGGQTEQAPTMAGSLSLTTYLGEEFTAVELPYKSGGFSMLILLPKGGQDPLHLLRTVNLTALPSPTHHRVDLQLPKFKIASQFGLTQSLHRLGLGELAAGFSAGPMLGADQRLTISQFLHAATIEVDENGTRAAAATGMAVATAIMREDLLTFHVDRPFAYVVWTAQSHVPLFVGTIYNPMR